jgi:hypothetical protein
MGRPAALHPSQRKEATRRRTQGATLQELAHSLQRRHIDHPPRHPRRLDLYLQLCSRGVATMSFDETMLPAYLTDIVSHFSDWAYRAVEAECLADAVSSPVFHYTTQQGLEGILSSGAIRLTHLGDLAKLGDDQEFLAIVNLSSAAGIRGVPNRLP